MGISYRSTGKADVLVGDGPVSQTEVAERPLLHKLQSTKQGVEANALGGLAQGALLSKWRDLQL